MSDAETPIEPFFLHEMPGPQVTAKDIVRALVKGGVPISTASARVQNYAKNRLIHTREKKSAAVNSPNIYSVFDVFAAKVLSALHDVGIADPDVLFKASVALYMWNLGHFPDGRVPENFTASPIVHAVAGVFAGQDWVFRLDFWRNPQTEARYVNAFLAGGPLPPAQRWKDYTPDFEPLASVVVMLEPHFLPLRYLVAPPAKGAH